MGTSVTVEQFVAKIERAAAAVERSKRAQLAAIGKDMERAHLAVLASALGGDNMFSGWKVPLVARATVDGSSGLSFKPVGRATGPERVAQSGRHQGMHGHVQGPALGGFSAKTGKQLKGRRRGRWNGTTQGKGTWDKTVAEFAVTVPKKLETGFVKAVSEVFG